MARVTYIDGDIPKVNGVSFYLRQGKLYARKKSSLSKTTTMSHTSLMNIQKSRDMLGHVSGYHQRLLVLMKGFMNEASLPIRHNEFKRKCYALVADHFAEEGDDAPLILRDYGGYLDGFVLGSVGFYATHLRPEVVRDARGGDALVWGLDTLSTPLALPYYPDTTHYRLVLFGFVIPEITHTADEMAYGEVLGHVYTQLMAVDAQPSSLDALRLNIKQPLKSTDSVVAVVGLCYYTEKSHNCYSEMFGVRAFSMVVL